LCVDYPCNSKADGVFIAQHAIEIKILNFTSSTYSGNASTHKRLKDSTITSLRLVNSGCAFVPTLCFSSKTTKRLVRPSRLNPLRPKGVPS